jgi:undecaprenyl pyrophosphate synthase
VKTQRLEGKVKDLNETLRTQHNQAEEVTERVSEDLAQAKLIKHGADRDLMQAMKTVTDMQA